MSLRRLQRPDGAETSVKRGCRDLADVVASQLQWALATDPGLGILRERSEAIYLLENPQEQLGTFKALESAEALVVLVEAPNDQFHCVVGSGDRLALDTELRWHYRIRIKSSFYVYRPGHVPVKVGRFSLGSGQALLLRHVYLTKRQYGPVHLALARPLGASEAWYIVSDQPTSEETFGKYGLRFDIEENFLDDKSNGFQLEASLFRSAEAISRLVLALAVGTLFLVVQGVEVVSNGKRRWVDPHRFRGNSYPKIG